MSRAFDTPAHVFMPQGPRVWPLQERRFPFRSAEKNEGVKSLTEMCLDVLDAAYGELAEEWGPGKRWLESGLVMPTAVEQNKRLCVVLCAKRGRREVWSNVF